MFKKKRCIWMHTYYPFNQVSSQRCTYVCVCVCSTWNKNMWKERGAYLWLIKAIRLANYFLYNGFIFTLNKLCVWLLLKITMIIIAKIRMKSFLRSQFLWKKEMLLYIDELNSQNGSCMTSHKLIIDYVSS